MITVGDFNAVSIGSLVDTFTHLIEYDSLFNLASSALVAQSLYYYLVRDTKIQNPLPSDIE